MKIKNQFAQMQTKDNFIKLLEIRKEKSLKNIYDSATTNLGWENFNNKGLLTVNMEIVDKTCKGCFPKNSCYECESQKDYKLVFDGYQRIKVSELLTYIQNTDIWLETSNLDWYLANMDLIKDYLKDEEYCIVYAINKEETFKANDWEV